MTPDKPAQIPPVYIRAGDVWDGVTVTIGDDQDPPQPVDLVAAGWSNWRSQFRPSPGSGEKVDLVVDDSDAASGVIAILATGADTQQMGDSGGYDLKATRGDGEPKTWAVGKVDWEQGYTRP